MIFITGTGTDMGKTYVTCMLLEQLRGRGYRVGALKPVISGFDPAYLEKSDSGLLLRAMGRAVNMADIAEISPWRYRAPLPPHIAAAQQGDFLSVDKITDFCRAQVSDEIDFLLIEGAGGVMSPLNHKQSMIDLMERLACSCLLVSGSYLGCLSHCLTAMSCLGNRNIALDGVVLSQSPQSYMEFDRVREDMAQIIPSVPLRAIARYDKGEKICDLII